MLPLATVRLSTHIRALNWHLRAQDDLRLVTGEGTPAMTPKFYVGNECGQAP